MFSPFVKVKPIKVPKKWTLAHVWKAILSGQITHGKINMILTDDYARDAADNFHIDKEIDLMQFARELVTDPDGWRVYRMGDSEDVIELGLSCYSFDLRTLYFARP